MESTFCAQLGKRIRELRLKKGWRQIDLAAHAQIHVSHLSGLETGRREICLLTLERIAIALEITPSELLLLQQLKN